MDHSHFLQATGVRHSRTLLTLAAFGAVSAAACAQSSVTLFGTIDINTRYVKTDGQPRRLSENPSGLNSGQFGIRGEEDLGGGLKAGFSLISENVADSGNAGDAARGKFWNRQSIVRLFGRLGELRLGRDYTPTYSNQAFFDAFGNVGLGNLLNVHQMYGGTRIDNSVGYVLPAGIGGVYGEAKIAAGEGGATFDRPGRYIGARIGYAAGAFNIAIAAAQQRFAVPFAGLGTSGIPPVLFNGAPVPAPAGSAQKTYNLAGSYDFGVVKLMALYDREELLEARENLYSVSAVIPIGVGEIHAGYDRSKLTNGQSTTIDQIKATYVYNLSKRTAVYTTVSRLDNKDATTATLPSSAGRATPGGKSQGGEVGIRHFF